MAQLPRIVAGQCTCVVCCQRVWTTEWDCEASVPGWTPATLVSSATIAGTCPSDVTWFQDLEDPCANNYIQYTPLSLLCEDCDDISALPPPANTRPEPSGCCDVPGNCCKYKLLGCYGGLDCDTPGWVVTVVSATPHVLCEPDSTWNQNAGDYCCYTRYVWNTGTPFDGTCDEPPDMSPPNGGHIPEFCCEETWCNCVYQSVWDCGTSTWSTPALITCSTSPTDDSSPWASVSSCYAQTTVSALGFCE